MGSIFAIAISSAILLTAMYLIYKWVLAGENQHAYNRGVLWAIYICAIAIPLLMPSIEQMLKASEQIDMANVNLTLGTPIINMTVAEEPHTFSNALLWIYLTGIVAVCVHTVLTAVKLCRIISNGERCKIGKFTLIITSDSSVAPFSWYRFIVMSREDYDNSAGVIITHEMRHLELRHWFDLLIAQLFAIFQWFNPAAWLMREELKTVHEYQADEAVITSGANPKEYQMLLIKKAIGARFPSLANSLNHSKLKKRVTMMYKSKSSVCRRLRALAIVPAGILAIATVNIPVVASAINEISKASVTMPSSDKNTKKTEDPQSLKLNGKVIKITGNAKNVTAKPKDKSSASNQAIYVNGEKQDETFDLNSISPDKIEAISIKKSGEDAGIHITTKK